MSEKKLKTAILGLNDRGLELLEAALETDLYEITAVADSSPEILQTIVDKYQCGAFEDYRQLVMQNQLDVLFVAAGHHLRAEHTRSAMKKKFNILKLIPPGLNFEQAAELFALAEKEKVRYTIANTARYSPGFGLLREYLQSLDPNSVHLITALCYTPGESDETHHRWLSDPRLAGGGVLLRDCYTLIDQIILNFGIPQQVYSLKTSDAPDRQQRLSITEDTAILTMKFSDTLMVNLSASRTFGPPQCQLRLHSAKEFVTVSEDSFIVSDNSGKATKRSNFKSVRAGSISRMLEDFALSIESPDKNKFAAHADVDINNMAVIESAYLSAKTSMPEEPGRILEMVGNEPTNWTSAAKKIV